MVDAMVVFGHKPLPNGNPSEQLAARMAPAVEALKEGRIQLLLISGGKTRKGAAAEYELGMQFVPQGLWKYVARDENSKTTADTVRHARSYLDRMYPGMIRSLAFVSSKTHLPRIRLITKRRWPEMYGEITFTGVGPITLSEAAKEAVLFTVEYLRLTKFVRRVFVALCRNGEFEKQLENA